MTKTIERGIPLPPEIMDDLTRREFLIGVGLIALAPACGSGGEGGESEPSGETRSVEDFYGSVEVPDEPGRIVAPLVGVLANLVALGVGDRVVGADLSTLMGVDYLAGEIEGVENITGPDGINVEAVAALDPDLVIYVANDDYDYYVEDYERLSQLTVPVYAAEYGWYTLDLLTTCLRDVGAAIGQEARADELVADLFGRIESIREGLGEGIDEMDVSVLRVSPDGYSVRVGVIESALMREIGIPRPPNQRDDSDVGFNLSLERVEDIDAYAIFVYTDVDGEESRERLTSNPLWQRLDAVKNDRVFFVDAGAWNGADIISANIILDELEKHLVEEQAN